VKKLKIIEKCICVARSIRKKIAACVPFFYTSYLRDLGLEERIYPILFHLHICVLFEL
jgi:hypothetical protein